MKDELAELMGSNNSEINLKNGLTIILVLDYKEVVKQPFVVSYLHLKTKKNKRPLLLLYDIYRPAAIDQLGILADQVGVNVFQDRESKNAVKIAQDSIKYAKDNGYNVVIIDTAGRLAVDEQMMNEISEIKNSIQPQETLFVVDSMTGQDAVNTAKSFNDRLDFNGVVPQKLDGDTRGGAALTIRSVVDKPIKFIGTSEKMNGLDVFHPDRMASRILGMLVVISRKSPATI